MRRGCWQSWPYPRRRVVSGRRTATRLHMREVRCDGVAYSAGQGEALANRRDGIKRGVSFCRWQLLLFWGESDESPHMLGKLRSRGSQGFTSSLLVANLPLPGIAKGRDTSLHPILFPALLLLLSPQRIGICSVSEKNSYRQLADQAREDESPRPR